MEQMMEFNPNDLQLMRNLMKKHGYSSNSFFGENVNGEQIELSIFTDKIMLRTYQHNGWSRLNIYHYDGTTEEIYEGKYE